ncbi:MAG: Biopolymer transport protein ExbB [Lentisphaerae bacterium ADurb.BinA184]|nr:MAG: Biopolymer transport protein ExbB [Lentisphaerae bacterium ADurb.BinA184]
MHNGMGNLMTRISAVAAMMAAAAARAAAEAGDAPRVDTLRKAMEVGGWTMWILLALSAIGLFLILFFIFTMRVGVLAPHRFVGEATDACEAGDLGALQALGQSGNCAAARILSAAAEQIAISRQFDYAAVRDAVEDEGGRIASGLWQRVQYLLDIAVVAPMVGFFGTVLGMLDSFAGMQTEIGAVRPESMAQGVAKALITTVAGLIVGITAMILFAVFRGRLNQIVARLEETCSLLLRKFIGAYLAKAEARKG